MKPVHINVIRGDQKETQLIGIRVITLRFSVHDESGEVIARFSSLRGSRRHPRSLCSSDPVALPRI